MQTFLSRQMLETREGKEANRILRSCVHCGFCTATCPTYRLLGDELDSPRGRIYLIKGLLENEDSTEITRTHLDRCLTCRACETFCPSGVEYGHLIDIGRQHLERSRPRTIPRRTARFLLRRFLTTKSLFAFCLSAGQMLRPLFPGTLQKKIPLRQNLHNIQAGTHPRRVILARGCVQSSLSPQTNQATISLLGKLGITAIECKQDNCCGAIDFHMCDTSQARKFIRKNIEAWWPLVQAGAEAIVSTASGCGVMIKDYGYILKDDTEYADKAATISSLARDVCEILGDKERQTLRSLIHKNAARVVFQSPCTLQHGQKLAGRVESLLEDMGVSILPVRDGHLCCGSAGVYSLVQKTLSEKLREEKMQSLLAGKPDVILTANIGCQQHLQQSTDVPVLHWVEYICRLAR